MKAIQYIKLFISKTQMLGFSKAIKLFYRVRKIKKNSKKCGNLAIGYYSMWDTTTGN